jgi:peptidoglycan hydrolase CwlO-like protein
VQAQSEIRGLAADAERTMQEMQENMDNAQFEIDDLQRRLEDTKNEDTRTQI